MMISGNVERFQYFNFATNFLKNEWLFQKMEYHFLAESTKIGKASFPYKTAMSEINFKTDRKGSTK